MKKFRRLLALVVLLAVSLLTLAIAEEKSEILIDASRNAAIKIKTTEDSDGVTGTFNLTGEVAKGLVAGNVDLKFGPEAAKEIGDAQGALHYTMTNIMEMVGNLDMPLPPDVSKELTKLNANVESVSSESKAYAKGDFAVDVKTQEKIPAVNVDFNAKGDGKTFDGKLNFDVDLGEEAAQAPFKTFDFGISEANDATTLSLGGSVPAGSPMAAQLKQIGQQPDQIKQVITTQLGSAGITVEKVEIGEYKEENGTASAKLAVTLKGWREKVKSTVPGAVGGGAFDAEKLSKSINLMLGAKFDSVTFSLKMEGKTLKGDLGGKLSNTKDFFVGYYQLVTLIAEAQLKDQGDSEDFAQQFFGAYQAVALEEAQKVIQVAFDSEMGVDLKGKMKMTAEGPEKKDLKISGDFASDVSNYAGYISKAQAAGLPAPKNSALKLNLGLGAQGRLTGSVFAYSDANVIGYYKKLLLETAKKSGVPAESLALAEKVEFKGSEGSLALTSQGLKGANYFESNDLTPVFGAILAAASEGKFEGDLTGFSLDGKAETEKMDINVLVNFAKFLPGKSAAQVKEAINAPSKATVKEGVAADQVKLVAVTKPEVSMPDSLQSVAADGKKLLETSPMAGLSGALGGRGGSSGGGNMLYILGGLAAVGVVGVGVAAGRKKS